MQCHYCHEDDHAFEQCPYSPQEAFQWTIVGNAGAQQPSSSYYFEAVVPSTMVVEEATICDRCNACTHTADECRSKVCTNEGCPRPVGHTAENCWKCDRCHKLGHLVATCRVPVCTYCDRIGHVAADCFKAAADSKPKTCHFCRKEGHVKQDCRKLQGRIRRATPPCTECNSDDHGVGTCPYLYRNRKAQAIFASIQTTPAASSE